VDSVHAWRLNRESWLCDVSIAVLEQIPRSVIIQSVLQTSTEEACEDRLIAAL